MLVDTIKNRIILIYFLNIRLIRAFKYLSYNKLKTLLYYKNLTVAYNSYDIFTTFLLILYI